MYYLINTSQNKVLVRSEFYDKLNEIRTQLYIKGAEDCLVIVQEVRIREYNPIIR